MTFGLIGSGITQGEALYPPGMKPSASRDRPFTTLYSFKGENHMLYHLDFQVEYSAAMSQKDLFSIWAREADAALGAKKAGVVVDLWKCVGSRRVVAVVNVDSPDTLDQILFDLPIMKENGQHVHIDVTPLRRYEDFAADVKKRLE
jgi:muconolactone delta-isomerase